MSDDDVLVFTIIGIIATTAVVVSAAVMYDANRKAAFLTECVKVDIALECGRAWSKRTE